MSPSNETGIGLVRNEHAIPDIIGKATSLCVPSYFLNSDYREPYPNGFSIIDRAELAHATPKPFVYGAGEIRRVEIKPS